MSRLQSASVIVCIATRRRPSGLTAVLRSLSRQTWRDFAVCVVENDPIPKCEDLCSQLATELDLNVLYLTQTFGGIPHARNRALDAIPSDAEWVAFIDDDEEATEGWIASLLEQASASRADMISGPIVPRYHGSVPQWLMDGRFFERSRSRSGDSFPFIRTSNALVRASLIRMYRFDERLEECGGSDTLISMQMTAAGATCVWSDTAVVTEFVPEDRGRTSWLVRRSFRYGNTLAIIDRLTGRSMITRTAKGVGLIVLGSGHVMLGLLRSRAHRFRGFLRIARGAGALNGVSGGVYREYRTDT